jgi:hypothetical protein
MYLGTGRVQSPSATPPRPILRKTSSLQQRQEGYRKKRTSAVGGDHFEKLINTDGESSNILSSALEEAKLAEPPARLYRLTRAVYASNLGHTYEEEVKDIAPMVPDLFGFPSCPSLYDQSLDGRKRHAQDILMLREIRAGVVPEQLLKKIPSMGNLVSVDLSHYGLGDELGKCLGTRSFSLSLPSLSSSSVTLFVYL